MRCNLILNLANSIWFANHKDIDVLSDCKWINENLNYANDLLIYDLSPELVTTLKEIRSIVINVFEGIAVDKQMDFLNKCLSKATFYNQLTLLEGKPTVELLSTSSRQDRLVATIIIELIESISKKMISRIRKCGVKDCQFYFLDKSKNQNKKYCSGKCNNVAKVRRFREKNRN